MVNWFRGPMHGLISLFDPDRSIQKEYKLIARRVLVAVLDAPIMEWGCAAQLRTPAYVVAANDAKYPWRNANAYRACRKTAQTHVYGVVCKQLHVNSLTQTAFDAKHVTKWADILFHISISHDCWNWNENLYAWYEFANLFVKEMTA